MVDAKTIAVVIVVVLLAIVIGVVLHAQTPKFWHGFRHWGDDD